jgi:hypothetical protein
MITLADSLERLPKPAFLRAWCAIAYLHPGLHPDGYESADSGWSRVLRNSRSEMAGRLALTPALSPRRGRCIVAEAWRHADAGELTQEHTPHP